MTVSTIVGPFMVYLDRFVIGAVASMSVVAYYTTPYALVSRLWVLPLSLIGVLFPIFSRTFLADREHASALLFKGIRYVSLMLFPPVLVIVALAREGLGVWLGPAFAEHSATVLQCLAAAVFFNSLAQVAFSLVQAAGRADLTARLHLVELPLYLAALWAMIASYGVVGAAIAWAARVIVDTIVLFAFVWCLVPETRPQMLQLAASSLGVGATFALAAFLPTTGVRLAFVAVTLAAFAVLAWRFVLTADERSRLRHPLGPRAAWQAQ
jgi:O-antigen/teichoic acid export membrane protein